LSHQATINKDPVRYGVTTVYSHPAAKADIILVHGLNGAPKKTWTASNEVYWPTDLLPGTLGEEHANVLVYGWNADVYGKNPSHHTIHRHAEDLVTMLTQHRKRQGTERKSILWVVHSLGGILTKLALLYSNNKQEDGLEEYRSIYVSTYGIIFLGTPHNGSKMADLGAVIQRIVDAVVLKRIFWTQSVLLKSLKTDSETLQSLNDQFKTHYHNFKVHMVRENHMTDVKGTK
jgi:hypothetical protein